MAKDPDAPPPASCWWCDLMLAPLWLVAALVLNVKFPTSIRRGDRLLFALFWALPIAAAAAALVRWIE